MTAAAAHAEGPLRVRRALSAGLEAALADLRQLRSSRRIAEIAFFCALWAAGIAAGLAGLGADGAFGGTLRLLGIGASAAALNAFYLLSHEGHHHLLFRRA